MRVSKRSTRQPKWYHKGKLSKSPLDTLKASFICLLIKKQDQCPSARCICSLEPLARFGNTDTSSTRCHARRRFPSRSLANKPRKSFAFCTTTVRQNTDLSRLSPVESDQDGVWRRPLQERWPGGEQQPSWHPGKEAWHLGAALFITARLPTLTPRLHFCLWFSLLAPRLASVCLITLYSYTGISAKNWIVRRTKPFPVQQIRQVFQDSGNSLRKAELLKDPLGFFFFFQRSLGLYFSDKWMLLVLCLTFHGEK